MYKLNDIEECKIRRFEILIYVFLVDKKVEFITSHR